MTSHFNFGPASFCWYHNHCWSRSQFINALYAMWQGNCCRDKIPHLYYIQYRHHVQYLKHVEFSSKWNLDTDNTICIVPHSVTPSTLTLTLISLLTLHSILTEQLPPGSYNTFTTITKAPTNGPKYSVDYRQHIVINVTSIGQLRL